MTLQIFQDALSLHRQGRFAEAAMGYQQVLRADARNVEALNLLGLASRQLGAYAEAIRLLKKCVKIKPDFAAAHAHLGDAQCEVGDLKSALLSLKRAVALDPGLAEAHSNLGYVLHELEHFEEAVASYQRALALRPELAATHNHLGNAYLRLDRLAEAEASFRCALALFPEFVPALNNLGAALKKQDRRTEAETCFRRAIELAPAYAPPFYNLGTIVALKGADIEAEELYRQALERQPDYLDALVSLGPCLLRQFRIAEGNAMLERALDRNPNNVDAFSQLLFWAHYLGTHSPESRLERARQCGRTLAKWAERRYSRWNANPAPDRLRVGIVSGDLRAHPVGHFLESVLAHLDPARLELFAYPTVTTEDAVTERLRRRFSAWRPLPQKHKDAAQRIHDDGVHILVDLSGHTASNYLPVFAWKPAPVQVSWLGYFATTGVAEMDYLLADPVGVPESARAHFTEDIWYLPETRLCFTAPDAALQVAALPALANDFLTFGCFQNLSKLSDSVLTAWARILSTLPEAKLRLQAPQYEESRQKDRLLARFQHFGIDSDRLMIHGKTPRDEYLAAHNEVDFILDTFPYPGGTTTCEALWMGVPTLTLAGDTLLARQGVSLLTAAGLPEWIAKSTDEYIEKAIDFAGDLPKLARLRDILREQVLASPLFDAPRFARNLEDALWGMWRARKSL